MTNPKEVLEKYKWLEKREHSINILCAFNGTHAAAVVDDLWSALKSAQAEIDKLRAPVDGELREKITEIVHDEWQKWAENITPELLHLTKEHAEGCKCKTCVRLARWFTLFKPYSDLSEGMKEYDRTYADAILALLPPSDTGWEKVKDCPERSMLNYPEGPCCVEMPCHGTGEVVMRLTAKERDRWEDGMVEALKVLRPFDGLISWEMKKQVLDRAREVIDNALTLDGARLRRVKR